MSIMQNLQSSHIVAGVDSFEVYSYLKDESEGIAEGSLTLYTRLKGDEPEDDFHGPDFRFRSDDVIGLIDNLISELSFQRESLERKLKEYSEKMDKELLRAAQVLLKEES